MKVGVIGTGILGASTAYHLAKSGVDVIMVDRDDIGKATDAGAGIICPWLSQRRNQRWYELVRRGARFYRTLIPELQQLGVLNTGYEQVGAISVHTDLNKLEKMRERVLLKKADAPEIGNIQMLHSNELKRLFPFLNDSYNGLFISGAARVNGKEVCQALVNGAIQYGAQFIEGDGSILTKDNVVTGVKVNDEVTYCDKVIVTAGAWARELLKPLGLSFQVKPQRAQIVHLKFSHTEVDQWPVIITPTSKYILGFQDGRVVVGSTYEDSNNYEPIISTKGQNELLNVLEEVTPQLLDSHLLETKIGFRPVVPDFLPVFGDVKQFRGLYAGNGLGATGLTAGPFLGSELAQYVQEKETTVDVEQYYLSETVIDETNGSI
ncbi:FAD-binding oxidoreductase [Halalkalibacter sp. APA_J-10(15)]|uniref:NAD(P)/FAD-dependent oxidoreductase n=1 Tax=unclassified Halalkalibacter TaxID=2893063 RepID=UPI001FF6EA11|nr:FAD-dependent oxidoreductase [Halalkalibacter sp. APA_J-10(15)]MCK0473129.1 FAD-binding oxidoreductase [Halalkalibacter sp. APA_J-10(15)]